MEPLIVIVLGLLVIAATAVIAPRVGVAAPLLLVLTGIGVSVLPVVPPVHVEPEWVLAGVLPPLLYSAAVSMPAMDFRREFRAISGLSVVLVVASSLVIGWFATLLVPGLPFAWGVALGAVVSPTDAVATSIVRRLGVSPRVVAVLDGEGLLNDATALVVLRTAIAGAAASVSLGGVLGDFLFAVLVAGLIGFVVGHVDLAVRGRVRDATVNTVLSFTAPFLASVPAEQLGASGLVAAVMAGVVTGYDGPRRLPPQHRLSDAQNWRTVELVLEGAVFLVTGLQLATVVADVRADHGGTGTAVALAAGALVI
ncbi:cation:proton antiporter, partial [Modestobacter versicolor]